MAHPPGFHDCYIENRTRSTLYRWFSFFDLRPDDMSPLDDLLGDGPFEIVFPGSVMRSREDVKAWYTRHHPPMTSSGHDVRGIAFVKRGPDSIEVLCDVVWSFAFGDGPLQVLPANVRVELVDQPGPFMRIRRYQATAIPQEM